MLSTVGDTLGTVGMFSTLGDIMMHVGGYLEYRRGIMMHVGDILSTVGDIMIHVGGYHDTCGGIS